MTNMEPTSVSVSRLCGALVYGSFSATNMIHAGPNQLSFIDASLIPGIMGADGMPKGPSQSLLLISVVY